MSSDYQDFKDSAEYSDTVEIINEITINMNNDSDLGNPEGFSTSSGTDSKQSGEPKKPRR